MPKRNDDGSKQKRVKKAGKLGAKTKRQQKASVASGSGGGLTAELLAMHDVDNPPLGGIQVQVVDARTTANLSGLGGD